MSRISGIGISYRPEFAAFIDRVISVVDLFEVLPDDCHEYPEQLTQIERIAEAKPLIAHSLTLSVGSADRASEFDLSALRGFLDRFSIDRISDHLCVTRAMGIELDNFLPVYGGADAIDLCCANITHYQSCLGRPIDIENVVVFARWHGELLADANLISAVAEKSNCGILLDLNNLYVNAENFKFDPFEYLKSLPADRVAGIHVAGFSHRSEGFLVDSHAEDVSRAVWSLLEHALRSTSAGYVVLERDNQSASHETIMSELAIAKDIWRRARG